MSTDPSIARPLSLVAGASRGLGLLIARELGRRGHRVAICARDSETLERAATQLREAGVTVTTYVCDVGDQEQVERMINAVEAADGVIDTAIVVAGVIQVGPLDSLSRSHFVEAIDIMLWGPINLGLALASRMRDRGRGRIGVITSIGGLVSVPHLLPYSTAKFGAVGFAQGLRAELAGTGVSVTTVAPGLMRTGSHLRAKFVGKQGREFAWFSAGASMPLVSMDADRAAARIVDGVLAGRAMVVLTPLAQVAMRVNALFPGATAALLSVMSRLLPRAPGGRTDTVEGHEARGRLSAGGRVAVDRITTLGRRAAARNNEAP
jgi:short-subunit dehydrogenase